MIEELTARFVADPGREAAQCPACANTRGIRDGGPGLKRRRAYDVLHDTFGWLRCPHCGFRGGAAAFRPMKTQEFA